VHPPHLDRASALAADTPNVRFSSGDAYALDAPDGHYQLVACRHVIQSLPNPTQVLRELRRVTAPGGHVHLLAEDYGMMHFHPTALDTDRFWREGPWRFAQSIDNDLRIGRKAGVMLRACGFEEVGVNYLTVDTLRVDRQIFVNIWQSWADAYTEPIVAHSGLSLAEVQAHWTDMIACIRSSDGYAVWHVPVWWAR
jgi:ubiquinone/menaquinone biosynthesis C-methylase UbiE